MLKTPKIEVTHLPEQVATVINAGRAIVTMVLRYELPLTLAISNEWHRMERSTFDYGIIGLPGFTDVNIELPGRDTDFIVQVRDRESGAIILRAFKYGDDIVSTDNPMLHDLVEQFYADVLKQP